MGEDRGEEAGEEEVGTVAGADVADGIISWHGGRVGPLGSTVGLVVGLAIAKAVTTEEERGEEIEEETGAVAGACTEIVSGALGGAAVGAGFGNRRGGTHMQYSISFHGPPTGPSGPFGASIFCLVITQPPAPKKPIWAISLCWWIFRPT